MQSLSNYFFSGNEYFRVAKFVFSPIEFFVESVFRLLQHEITRSNFISFLATAFPHHLYIDLLFLRHIGGQRIGRVMLLDH